MPVIVLNNWGITLTLMHTLRLYKCLEAKKNNELPLVREEETGVTRGSTTSADTKGVKKKSGMVKSLKSACNCQHPSMLSITIIEYPTGSPHLRKTHKKSKGIRRVGGGVKLPEPLRKTNFFFVKRDRKRVG